MLIVCPNCATSYRVAAENFGEGGRSVRCISCYQVWFEEPRALEPQPVFPPSVAQPQTDAWDEFRPPLNDIVEVGGPGYSQEDSGHAAEQHDPTHFAAEPAEELQTGTLHDAGDAAATNVERLAFRPRPARTKKPQRRMIPTSAWMPALICVLMLTLTGLVMARQQVVHRLPQTASLYALLGMPVNLRGLQFENIKTVREVQDGVPVLVVEGDIIGSARLTEVPRLRFAVLDRSGREIYAWTARPDRTLLPPGENLPFRSRLASPPADASGITVRFFNRHDTKAGFM